MRPVGTVVAFGAGPRRAAGTLDATALACEILEDFPAIKRAEAGSLVIVLIEHAGDAAFAGAAKAIGILRRRGANEALVVPPALEADPGPRALAHLQRMAGLARACVVQPVRTLQDDAVRCFVEPLSIFGLVGVEAHEIRALAREPRVALLHDSVDQANREARATLVTCRLRPNSTLREVDDAAREAAERAPDATLILAGPEVADAGPRVLAASFL